MTFTAAIASEVTFRAILRRIRARAKDGANTMEMRDLTDHDAEKLRGCGYSVSLRVDMYSRGLFSMETTNQVVYVISWGNK